MSDSIDSRVTPSLHVHNVTQIDGYDESTRHLLGPTETAFSEAYVAIGKVHDARAAAKRNPVWNEAEQLIQTQNFADKMFNHVAKHFDGALNSLNRGITSLEADLTAPVEAKASYALAVEIRAHTKSLPTEERMTFIKEAITAGDARTAESILGAPAFLSGISSDMQATLTRMYHEHHQPDKSKRLKAMKGAADLIRDRSGLLFGELEKAVGASPEKVAALRAAKNSAENAFRFSGH